MLQIVTMEKLKITFSVAFSARKRARNSINHFYEWYGNNNKKNEQEEDNYIILIDQPWFVVIVDDVHITLKARKGCSMHA